MDDEDDVVHKKGSINHASDAGTKIAAVLIFSQFLRETRFFGLHNPASRCAHTRDLAHTVDASS